ncbi:MAG: tetratricopeptide repeat protein [Candidatus Heimdallarchaeaceae archaeon]
MVGLDKDSLFYSEYQEQVDLALSYVKEGKLDSAISSFQQLILSFPDYSLAYFYLGTLYSIQNKYQQALSCFSQAWDRKSDSDIFLKELPFKSVFLLVSQEKVNKRELQKWVSRAKLFYDTYETQQRALIDIAEELLQLI